jgi:hypothetical protein
LYYNYIKKEKNLMLKNLNLYYRKYANNHKIIEFNLNFIIMHMKKYLNYFYILDKQQS